MVFYENQRYFIYGFVLFQLLSLACLILTGVWTGVHLGGFSWQSNPHKEFNYHILFMVTGFVYLYGNGILIYRLLQLYRKTFLKILHTILFIGTFILAVIALKAVFDSHNLREKPVGNLYTLHSWIGLGTVILFTVQLCFGVAAYLLPLVPLYWREYSLPMHKYFGISIYVLGICSCVTGFTEKVIFRVKEKYEDLPEIAVIGNVLGVLLIFLAFLVVYLVFNPHYKRQPLSEEDTIQLRFRD